MSNPSSSTKLTIRLHITEALWRAELRNRQGEVLCQVQLPKAQEDLARMVRLLLAMGNSPLEDIRGIELLGPDEETAVLRSYLQREGLPVIE